MGPAAPLLLALLLAVPACHRTAPRTGEGGELRSGRIRLEAGAANLWVEVADRPDTRQTGLMFRRSLPEDEGMLFVFEEPQMLEFWMKNTYVPLDIAFIASDGRILNIEAMKPLDDGPRYRSKGSARYAVEANRGWFDRHGVKPGDQVHF